MPPANRKAPQRSTGSDSRYSLMAFMRDFPTDDACLEWLWRTRYADDGVHASCPSCDALRPFKRYATRQQRQSWTCTTCGHHLHPTAGTIFHKSSTSLHLWFYAMYLITSTRCGISAKQLERELGVTYKTAWRMFRLIRKHLMTQDETPLSGSVEADETYIGGKPRLSDRIRGEHGGWKKGRIREKIMVFGTVERGDRVRAEVVPAGEKGGIGRRLHDHVSPLATLYTDQYVGYKKLGKRYVAHHRIRHDKRVYVSGDVHTSTIDGFWSLVKRGINGVYHSVSAKHLPGYLNEYAWRYNHRKDGQAQFAGLLLRSALRR